MKKFIFILLVILSACATPKDCCGQIDFKKYFKYSTFYAAVYGGNSISDVNVYSVTNGLETSTIATPFDYNVAVGIRKIARFGYENRANTFYDGTEDSWSDGANIGKVSGLEFLFEGDYKRQQGENYLDQHHFIRYVNDKYILKGEYLQDGFADIKYFETSQRYRKKISNKLSINIGAAQRLSEPYGFDPLEEWVLSTGDIHYTNLAIEEGYEIDVYNSEYKDDFISTLPGGGWKNSTLKKRLTNEGDLVRAKTGGLSGVRNLAGYIKSKKYGDVAFSILINGYTDYSSRYARVHDQIVKTIIYD